MLGRTSMLGSTCVPLAFARGLQLAACHSPAALRFVTRAKFWRFSLLTPPPHRRFPSFSCTQR